MLAILGRLGSPRLPIASVPFQSRPRDNRHARLGVQFVPHAVLYPRRVEFPSPTRMRVVFDTASDDQPTIIENISWAE